MVTNCDGLLIHSGNRDMLVTWHIFTLFDGEIRKYGCSRMFLIGCNFSTATGTINDWAVE